MTPLSKFLRSRAMTILMVVGLTALALTAAAQQQQQNEWPATGCAAKCLGSSAKEIEAVAAQVRASKGVQLAYAVAAAGGWYSYSVCRMTLDLPATGAPGASSNLSAAIECADWAGIVPFEPLKTSATTLRTKTHRRPITADEERRLREILKDPAFWSGSTDGKDTRHGDGSIQRIEMVSGGQRAFMVSSSNPTFSEGARKDLRAILQRIILEVMS